jgi:hypothetical protein
VGLEWGPLSPVSTTEELLGRKSSGSSLENRSGALAMGHSLYVQKLALILLTSGSRSVSINNSGRGINTNSKGRLNSIQGS